MRIAIIVLGLPLLGIRRNLETTNDWFADGPMLPLEFARISGGNRVTLVIKPSFDNVTTMYAISSHDNLAAARANLAAREGTPNLENIGFVDCRAEVHHARPQNSLIIDTLKQWNQTRFFDAIIWSDFAPNFSDRLNRNFTLANVIAYITCLPENEKKATLEYIRKAPEQITTRFRAAIKNILKVKFLSYTSANSLST